MTLTLTDYQTAASVSCTFEVRDAQRVFDAIGKKTAIGLCAPTGAGKTVIATDVLERLMFGEPDTTDVEPNPDLTVLWVTDDPALNRQTLDKMLVASARLTDGDFIEVDSSLDQPRLERGRIHFAHVQLFGKGTTSMQPSNSREHGLWAMVANSVNAYGSDFVLIIDEAHRGTGKATRDSATIVARLCHGGDSDHFTGQAHPPAPVIFGITATPARFKQAMDRAGRSLEMVDVPVADVRESGLLKDRIVVRHPGENQPSEATLLAQAVASLRASDAAWRTHTDALGLAPVQPLLVIQVAPGISDARVGEIVSALASGWSDLSHEAVRHAFDSHATIRLPGSREVHYIAPDRIAGDLNVRAVLFKNALTTGWDCPRAEVMLSLRSASDFTNIAQLIGRMVRTPLAERIETDETLNAVTLYLPHYDRAQVAKVVAALGEDTGGEIEVEIEPVDCFKRPDVPADAWTLLAALPSTARVKKPWRSETDRFLGLARLLRGHDLLDGASAKAQARLVGAIKTEVSVRKAEVEALVADVETLDMTETVWDNRKGEFVEGGAPEWKVSALVTDVDAQFAAAVRALPDGSAKWYWNTLLDDEPDLDPYDAKARVAALTKTPEMTSVFRGAIENAAAHQVAAWRTEYGNKVQMLPKKARLDFEAAWNPQAGVLTVDIEVPDVVSAPTEKITGTGEHATTTTIASYDRHLYVAGEGHRVAQPGQFPAVLTGWEIDVLAKERAHDTLTGWYRNPARSKHGLAVPYRSGTTAGDAHGGGEWALLYPDFLFFHAMDDEHGGSEHVVDIVDPHRHNEADTGPKWAGLARWARTNSDKVRRVVGVIKVGDTLKALDLTQDDIAEALEACSGKNDIEALFAARGSLY